MSTTLLAATSGPGISTQFTLASGDTATLALRAGSGLTQLPRNAEMVLQYLSGAEWIATADKLNTSAPVRTIASPGTFRLVKDQTAEAFGLERD